VIEEEAPLEEAALDNGQEQEGEKSDKEQGLSISLNEIIVDDKIIFGTDLIVDALVNRLRQQHYQMEVADWSLVPDADEFIDAFSALC
jgi:hypothetical protein